MVTATDDQSDRLSALEAGVAYLREQAAETNARLTALETGMSEIRTEIRDMRTEIRDMRTEIRDMRTAHQADMRQVNARIDRVFYAVIGVGAGIIGAILTLTFRLT